MKIEDRSGWKTYTNAVIWYNRARKEFFSFISIYYNFDSGRDDSFPDPSVICDGCGTDIRWGIVHLLSTVLDGEIDNGRDNELVGVAVKNFLLIYILQWTLDDYAEIQFKKTKKKR